MSGHSHWAGIKHKKGLEDKKRSKIFSKLNRMISIAAKAGTDPEINSKLKVAIEQAKSFNMPSDTIERAVKKAAGGQDATKLEEFLYEAIGPGKIAIIIEGITDNKNRAMLEIKQILNQRNGKFAQEGSLRWQFQQKGVVRISLEDNPSINKDDLELEAIELGAENVIWRDDVLEIHTKPNDTEKLKNSFDGKNIKILSSELEWIPNEEISVSENDKTAAEKLFEALDDSEDVQNFYSNLKE
ncbi:MAG: YebC/PmpR family DNA-binding transcriptional regulator [Candidatus Paceibacterota bacterium]|jgi:YebC/PmpR family DNA-binding regulatory protein|nr:YebC/PmpR family DNA-binding transcriptional regulator [Candidatus Paceibacterota bacterium]